MFLEINNKKGFTLFTALVSLLLISVTLVLLFNMIKTEETYLSVIANQSSMSDLITIGDLARADAFDSFIVALRFNWETANSSQDQRIILDRSELDTNWSDFVQIMANKQFFSMNFAGYFATALLLRLQYTVEPPGYKLVLEQLEEDTTSGSLESNGERYKDIVNQMFLDGGNKIDVVNCSNDNPEECTGSFYITIDATQLSDENYELLPKINVLRHKSQDVIQRPIFGRQVYKIYMPWRGFQALRTARRIAHSTDAEISDNPGYFNSNGASDVGLFNPKIHNTLEQARLGVCEPQSCDYRKDLFKTVSADGFSASCLSPSEQAVEIRPVTPSGGFSNYTPSVSMNYNLDNLATDSSAIFNKLIERTTKLNLMERSALDTETIVFNNGLEMLSGDGLDGFGDVNILQISTTPSLTRTKQIIEQQSAQSVSLNAFSSQEFLIDTPNTLAGGFGIFYNTELQRARTFRELDSISGNTWPFAISIGEDYVGTTGQSINFSCSELENINILLKFKETDNRYRTLPSQETFIWVELRDSFTKYTFPPTNGFASLSTDSNTGYFTKESINGYITNGYLTEPNNTDNWICLDYKGVPDILTSPQNSCVAKEVN
jgi:hypothetical protein